MRGDRRVSPFRLHIFRITALAESENDLPIPDFIVSIMLWFALISAVGLGCADGGGGSKAPASEFAFTSSFGEAAPIVVISEGESFVQTLRASDPDSLGLTFYFVDGGADADDFFTQGSAGVLLIRDDLRYANPEDSNGDNVDEVRVRAVGIEGQNVTQTINESGDRWRWEPGSVAHGPRGRARTVGEATDTGVVERKDRD